MNRTIRRSASKAMFLVAAMVLLSTMVSAVYYGQGSAVTGFINQYFLPADAQVQGIAGLLFGVMLPVGIVLILFDIGATRVLSDNERAAHALAVMFSLFMIPSGAYKTISNGLIAVFGLSGSVGAPTINPVIPALGPLSGSGSAGIVSAVVFLGLLWMFQSSSGQSTNDIKLSELIGAVLAAVVVWQVLSGGFSFGQFFATGVVLGIGYFIFKTGLNANSDTGNIIAVAGLLMMIGAIRSTQMLPDNLDRMLGSVMDFSFLLLILILLGLVVAAMLLVALFFGGGRLQQLFP